MAREIGKYRENLKGMAAYGLDCVTNALKQPLSQIVENAGFNPLEKVEDVVTSQAAQNCDSLGIDCDTGEVADMLERGVIDPVPVKLHAIKAAGEVAVAILRIDTIIKKKEEGANAQKAGTADSGMPDF
jgi:chaperonin GroEL (HSP60 family)